MNCGKYSRARVKGKPVRYLEGPEYETIALVGGSCAFTDIHHVAYANYLCDNLGVDTMSGGSTIAFAMECYEKGIITRDDLEGHELKWGDIDGMIATIGRIVRRDGIGDVLADGIAPTAAHFGDPEIGMHVKNQGLPAYDPRGMKGMGIAYATSNRGACHLRAYTPASELGLIAMKTDPLAWEGKGELVKLMQDLHAFSDSLDLCKFSAFAMGADEYAAQYTAMTGVEITADDVLTAGERIYNLERWYNNQAGFGAGSDTLPARYTTEPSQEKGSEGQVCELDKMLEEYYRARGWVDGVVPKEKLEELEIS